MTSDFETDPLNPQFDLILQSSRRCKDYAFLVNIYLFDFGIKFKQDTSDFHD